MLEQLAIYNPDSYEKLCIVLLGGLIFAIGFFIGELVRLGIADERQLKMDLPWMDRDKAREARHK